MNSAALPANRNTAEGRGDGIHQFQKIGLCYSDHFRVAECTDRATNHEFALKGAWAPAYHARDSRLEKEFA
jgi:hypothetical protein